MAVYHRKERMDRGIKVRCENVYALSSYRELLYLSLPRVLPVVVLLILPLLKDIVGLYVGKVLVHTYVIALLALSWELIASVGLPSLGQAFFFGAGAYLAGILDHSFSWPFWLNILLATFSGAFLCTLALLPSLRLKGIYFALFTLVLPLMVVRSIVATEIFGGTEGMSIHLSFPNIWVESYIAILATFVCLFVFRRLSSQDYGMVLKGIRDNDRSVMAGGINIHWFKVQTLFIGALPAVFAGAFMAHCYQFVGISNFSADYSILPLASCVLGGVGNFTGAILGAFILVPISEVLRTFGTLRITFYCVILLICVIGLPEGIFHYIERRYHQFERRVEVG